jgi:hypothetical protein
MIAISSRQDHEPNAFSTTRGEGIPIEVSAEFDGGVHINAWREEGATTWQTVETCPDEVIEDVVAEFERENV